MVAVRESSSGTGSFVILPDGRAENPQVQVPLPVAAALGHRGPRIQVAFVLPENPFPVRSGRASRAVFLASGLRRNGFDVRFHVMDGAAGEGIHDGFRVCRLPMVTPWRNPIRIYEHFNNPECLVQLLQEPPDLAILSDPRALPSALLLGALGVRVLLDVPGVVEDAIRLTGGGTAELSDIKPVERLAAREPEGILVSCDTDRATLIRRHAAHEGRVVVLPTPACSPPAEPAGPGDSTVLWLGSAENRASRCSLRRVMKDLWPRIHERHPGMRLVLAGRGTGAFAGPSAHCIENPGDLETLFADARCLLAPQIIGGGAARIVDALSRGVPVVTTAQGRAGHLDLAGAGQLVGDSDDELVDAVCQLLENREHAQRLGAQAARAYRESRHPGRLLEPVVALAHRARRAWVGPQEKLRRLQLLPGRWPKEPSQVRSFLASRPSRILRTWSWRRPPL